MGIAKRTKSLTTAWVWLFVLWLASSCAYLGKVGATATERAANKATQTTDQDQDAFDEDELVQETIAAGRGHRDEHGIRDQWLSEEHLGNAFDSRKPISDQVQRLLNAYGLTCKGCDHNEAVRKINAYVQHTKKVAQEEKEAQEARDARKRNFVWAMLVTGLSAAYIYRDQLGLEFPGLGHRGEDLGGFSEAQRANILRLRREQAAKAASQRARAPPPPPTWLENERREVWTPKQEQQFQTALREFSGVPRKERYKLIAEKVPGKSRIECLTHHRMQELRAKQHDEKQQEGKQQ